MWAWISGALKVVGNALIEIATAHFIQKLLGRFNPKIKDAMLFLYPIISWVLIIYLLYHPLINHTWFIVAFTIVTVWFIMSLIFILREHIKVHNELAEEQRLRTRGDGIIKSKEEELIEEREQKQREKAIRQEKEEELGREYERRKEEEELRKAKQELIDDWDKVCRQAERLFDRRDAISFEKMFSGLKLKDSSLYVWKIGAIGDSFYLFGGCFMGLCNMNELRDKLNILLEGKLTTLLDEFSKRTERGNPDYTDVMIDETREQYKEFIKELKRFYENRGWNSDGLKSSF